ncbi:PDZ domain [Trinorchestia longiramus]|nr:PDZ domain [Trinorchestia longiramus]
MVCFSQAQALRCDSDRGGGSASYPDLPLTSQPQVQSSSQPPTVPNKTSGSLSELHESRSCPQEPIRPHRVLDPRNRPQSGHRTAADATMLATEQPLSHRPAPHHYGSNDGQESLEMDDRSEKYLYQDRYSPNVSSVEQQPRSFEPLDRRFPNGFPDFNNKFKNNSNNFFRNNISQNNDIERKTDTYCFDAGYSSEKSPEEDQAPSGFDIETLSSREQTGSPCQDDYTDGQTEGQEEEEQSLVLQMIDDRVELSTSALMDAFGFINEGALFDVTIEKNSRGLGMSVTGGRETRGMYAGLIRVKKLYPQMPAWLCGQLRLGDVLLEANGTQLSGLTSHEALEVLRTTRTTSVHLVLCRPPIGLFEDDLSASPVPAVTAGCPEVVSTSLMGHQLGPTDQLQVPSPVSICGILSVNNKDLCGLSHEEAIAFLRTTPDVVTIRLYRDVTQTPVSPLSPTEPEHSLLNPKPLRQEARDMLSDLALRKRSSPTTNSPGLDGTHSPSPGNPRRRRLHKTPTPDVSKPTLVDKFDLLVQGIEEAPLNMEESPAAFGNHNSSSLTNRDSCTSTLSANSTIVSRNASTTSTGTNSLSEASETRRRRPNFLDLENRRSCSRKAQFTPPHEIGDSFPSPNDDEEDNYLESIGSVDSAPACSNALSVSPSFAYNAPEYQSVHFGNSYSQDHARLTGTSSDFTLSSHLQQDNDVGRQKSGLMKWKGAYMGQESGNEDGCEVHDDLSNTNSGHAKSLRKKEVTISLHRGWNSRLGFSLKADNDVTRVVAVYAGCVAAKDGRLKVGDEIIGVNGNDVTDWRTEDVIDLLRKTHGKIELQVIQPSF